MHCARTVSPITSVRNASGATATISIGSQHGCKAASRRPAAPSAASRSRPRGRWCSTPRVEAGDWSQIGYGDLANLDGSGSHFSVTAVDDELRRRLRIFDIHPSGPLWGRGDLPSKGQALQHELDVSREFAAVADLLAAQGLTQERRALRCAIRELSVEREANTLSLSFLLGRGQFATAVLREICEFEGIPELDADEE
jgi:tRNA(Glu) U13 pseudouridine synthase TruD